MTMEQMGSFEDRRVILGNLMQTSIAESNGEDISVFIENRAAEFRDIINTHPEYLDSFQKDPEKTIQKVSSLLYH